MLDILLVHKLDMFSIPPALLILTGFFPLKHFNGGKVMSKYARPEEAPKEKGGLVHTFRLPGTLGTGAASLDETAAAVRRAEKIGDYGKTVYAHRM